jgi:glycine/D-amino acid oxidase-like deaminating enzyme
MVQAQTVTIIGAGIFGVTAALELKQRGYNVTLLDRGAIPSEGASSNDINKAVRVEYGQDEASMALVEEAIKGWRQWNTDFHETIYHEVGMTWLTQEPMQPGSYEYESFLLLQKRGHHPTRLNSVTLIQQRVPAWNTDRYVDGFFNPTEGYAESARTISHLIQRAEMRGVYVKRRSGVEAIEQSGGKVTGVRLDDGTLLPAEEVIVAAGAWSGTLVPDIKPLLKITAQPLFHIQPADAQRFRPPHFTVFGADTMRTGWYGFPVHPGEHVVKIGYHSLTRAVDPTGGKPSIGEDEVQALREFLKITFPELAEAELVTTRLCYYTNTPDSHFLIDRSPAVEGLTVATGGSGHAFKFGPVLGGLVADAFEGVANPNLGRFKWREVAG